MLKTYGFFGIIKLFINVFRTKVISKNARIIRFPIDIRGRKFIVLSKGFTSGTGCRLEALPIGNMRTLFIGKNVQINDYVHITARENVRILDNVLIASKVYISDCSHGSYSGDINDSNPHSIPKNRILSSKPVLINENVWIGESVSILPGVTIGKGAIVGANSVVTKSLPPYVIAVGVPAKVVKKFNFESNTWCKI